MTPEAQILQVFEYTMFPGGIVRFFKVKKDSNYMFFIDEGVPNERLESDQMVDSTALLFKIKIKIKIFCLQGPVNHARSLLDHSRWVIETTY
jgi:hypothetical protein